MRKKITTMEEALASAKEDGYNLRIITEDEDEDTAAKMTEGAAIGPGKAIRKSPAVSTEMTGFPYDVPVEKWKDRDFCLDAIDRDVKSIHSIPRHFWHDKFFCIQAIRISRSEKTLRYIDHSFWRDREFCLDVIRVCDPTDIGYLEDTPMDYFHNSLWRDVDFCLAAVRLKGDMLQYVCREKITPQVCEAAIAQDPYALEHVPPKIRTEKMILDAIRGRGRARRDEHTKDLP